MKKLLFIILLIMGCEKDTAAEPGSEIKNVAWIYYGNQNQSDNIMTGCYWINESFPNQTLGSDLGVFWFKDSNDILHQISCESFGRKDYIHHFIDYNYFSVYLESHINAQQYDTLKYEYMNN